MLMILVMLCVWALMIGAYWLSPSDGLPVMLVFFGAPVIAAFLMCRGNRKHDVTIGGTLFGAVLWGILHAALGGLILSNDKALLPEIPVQPDVLLDHSPSQERAYTLLFFMIAFAVVPPLLALIWRIILNIRARAK